ncbi:Stromal membrane-associated protein 2 [Wallemia ichthyophaga EXF-994]|uniref:Stromal membrane-associated protein 2 n=1 Tax=Wallemia ichthyophaga (strain EXF-994 / CBS 113033) TaxID=1299270 RepID=R9AUP2_WALI9|nr:Stromal membrane-associated protein 2 [Wallemia ichthyophaga EXF-994]EOR03791.1 Stromal membrane-associated protein 2 [Wallemia ichthyophaga EXF-994]
MSGVSKQQAERNHRRLLDILKVPGNGNCADCKASNPRWSSYSLGIFLCMPCASVHRKLGTHISKVKSVSLDNWNREQTATMEQIGNSRSNSVYNPDELKNPPPTNSSQVERDSEIEIYIRNKYIHKSYMRKSSSIPPPSKGILKASNTGSSTGSSNSPGISADLNANTSLNSRSSKSPVDGLYGLYKQRSASLQPPGDTGNASFVDFDESSTPQTLSQNAPLTKTAGSTSRSVSSPAQLMHQQSTHENPHNSIFSSLQSFKQTNHNTQPTTFSLNSPIQSNTTLQSIPQSNSPYQNLYSTSTLGSDTLFSQSPTSTQSNPNSPYTTPFQMHQNGIHGLNPAPLRYQTTGLSPNGSICSLNAQSSGGSEGGNKGMNGASHSGLIGGINSGTLNGIPNGMYNHTLNGTQNGTLNGIRTVPPNGLQSQKEGLQTLQPQQTNLRNQSSFSDMKNAGGALPGSFQGTLQGSSTGALQSQNTGFQSLQPQPTGKKDWPAPPSAPPISPTSQQPGIMSSPPGNGFASSGFMSTCPNSMSASSNSMPASTGFKSQLQNPQGLFMSPFQQQQPVSINPPFQQQSQQEPQKPFQTLTPKLSFQHNATFQQQSEMSPFGQSTTTNQASPYQLTPTQNKYSTSTNTQPVQRSEPLFSSHSQPYTNTNTNTFIQQPINSYQPTQQQSFTSFQPAQQQQFNLNPFQTMMRPGNNTNPFHYSFN